MGTVWITGGLFVLILVLLEESGFTQAHGTGAYGAGAGYGAAPYGGSGFGNAAATCTPEIRTAISLFLSTQGANMQNQGMNNISPAIAPLFSLCFPLFPLLMNNNNNNNNGLAAMAPFLMTGGFGMGGFGFPGGAPPLALAGAGAGGYGGGGY